MTAGSRERRTTKAVDYSCKVGNDITNDIYDHHDDSASNKARKSVAPPQMQDKAARSNSHKGHKSHNSKKNTHNKRSYSDDSSDDSNNSDTENEPVKRAAIQSTKNEPVKKATKQENGRSHNGSAVTSPVKQYSQKSPVRPSNSSANTFGRATAPPQCNQPATNRPATAQPSYSQHHSYNNHTEPTHHSKSTNGNHTFNPRDMITQLNHSDALSALLAEKDQSYAMLLEKYNAIKTERRVEAESVLSKLSHQADQHLLAAERVASHWKEQYQQLQAQLEQVRKVADEVVERRRAAELAESDMRVMRGDMQVLGERLRSIEGKAAGTDEAKAAVEKLQQELSERCTPEQQRTLEQENEYYRMMTSCRVTVTPTGFRCKVVNRKEKRVFEYDLTVTDDAESEVEYKPKKIDMKGAAYPDYLKDVISFGHDQLPLFTRNILDVVFNKQEEQLQATPAPASRS